MNRTTPLHGIIHGNIIKLANDPGLDEGQEVEVTLRPTAAGKTSADGLRRAAGALAESWQLEDDEILDQIQQDRMRSAGREMPS